MKVYEFYRIIARTAKSPVFLFFVFFSTSRWWAEGGAGREGLAVAQSAQHEALCRSEPLHPHPRQREGGAWIPGTQRKRGSVGELHQSEQDFIFKVVTRNVTLRLITYETDSQTHQIKINHPFKTNTDTDRDTPSDSQCSATPFTVFHNFTSSSFTPMMPCDTAVSHGNPIMTSSHCITFICPAQPWECIFGFPLQSTASCVFVFVRTLVYVPASMPARCCRLIPRISYGDEFTQEHSVPLQHFLRLQEVAVLLLMRDAERLNVAWSMETGQTVIRFTLWCILQWHWPGVLAHRHNKAVFSAHHLGLVWVIQHGLLFSLFFF